MDQIYIGVDVAKAWLDIYHPARGAKRIDNTLPSVRAFARAAAREGVWVIFEASGGYDWVLRDGLDASRGRGFGPAGDALRDPCHRRHPLTGFRCVRSRERSSRFF